MIALETFEFSYNLVPLTLTKVQYHPPVPATRDEPAEQSQIFYQQILHCGQPIDPLLDSSAVEEIENKALHLLEEQYS